MKINRKTSSSKRRPLIGVFVDGSTRYGRDIARGAMLYANAHRQWEVYGVLRRISGAFAKWPRCDGTILGGVTDDVMDLISANSKHVIACSGSVDPKLMPTVCLDDLEAGVMAAQHLLECGLKSFSYYGVPGKLASDNREKGLQACVQARGCVFFQCPLTFPGWTEPESGYPWIDLAEWLKRLPKPIGILAVDDAAASYLVSACRHGHINVPEQVAIIGVNNDEVLCEIACTPISSVEAGFSRMGYAAALMLDRLLKGEKLTASQTRIQLAPVGIVKRLSTDLYAIDDPQLADVVRYIRQHACDPCSVEDVAGFAAMGRRNLERRFVQKLARTPGEEILRVQMETAKRLLMQPELSIAVVADRSGFSGMSAFSRAFHRANDKSPSEYRRLLQKMYEMQSQ